MKRQELETIGFTRKPKKGYYGMNRGGFEIIVQPMGQKLGFIWSIQDDARLVSYLDHLHIHHDYVLQAYARNHECAIVIKMSQIDLAACQKMLDDFTAYLHQIHAVQLCHHCHLNKPVKQVMASGEMDIMCSDCFNELAEHAPVVTDGIRGSLGCLVFNLLPAVIWGLGVRVSLFVILVGILWGAMSYLGYVLYGHGIDLKGRLITLAMYLLTLLVSEYFALGIAVMQAYAHAMNVTVSYFEALSVVQAFIADQDVAVSVLTYLFLVSVFFIVTWVIINFFYSRYQKEKMTLKP